MGHLKRLVIHCTATPEGREITRKNIEQWHLIERGWSRVGYSDMIHLDGEVENLIPYNDDDTVDAWEISNGARGYNGTSRHVVYSGGSDAAVRPKDTRTSAQHVALAKYVAEFKLAHPDADIIGHNEISPKACPSFDVQTWLHAVEPLLSFIHD